MKRQSQSNRSGFETFIQFLENPFHILRLNPTVVVLKRCSPSASRGSRFCLNPTVVVLKPIVMWRRPDRGITLNPTVVVLKHAPSAVPIMPVVVSIQP